MPKRKARVKARRQEATAAARPKARALEPVVRAAAGPKEGASAPGASGADAALGGAPHGMPPRKGAQTANGPAGTVARLGPRNGKLQVRFLLSLGLGARVVRLS